MPSPFGAAERIDSHPTAVHGRSNSRRREQMASSSPQQSAGAKTNTGVEVVPLTLHIGADIRGVDLTRPLPAEQSQEIREAFLKWKASGASISITPSTSRWRASLA